MQSKVGHKTRQSLYWSLGLKIPNEAFRFFMSIVIARLLEPDDFGIVAIASMVVLYSNSITNFGFSQALVQRRELDDSHIDSVFTVDLAISVSLTGLLFVLAPMVADFFGSPEAKDVTRLLSVYLVISAFHNLPHALLRRNIEFKTVSLVASVQSTGGLTLTLILAWLGFKYWSLVWGQLIPLLGAAVYLAHRASWTPTLRYNHASMKQLFGFGLWGFARSQLVFINTYVDRFVVGKFLGTTALGIYDKALGISRMPNESIGMTTNAVMFSSFSRSQADRQELKGRFMKALLILSLLNFPIFLGLIVSAPHFVIALLGHKWAPMVGPLEVLAVAGLFMSAGGLIASFNVAVGKHKSHTLRVGFGSVILLAACFLLARFGVVGVASAIVLYSVVLILLTLGPLKKEIGATAQEIMTVLSPAFISGTVMAGVVKGMALTVCAEHNLRNLTILVLVGVCSYSLMVLAFPSPKLGELRNLCYRDLGRVLARRHR